MKGRIPRLGSLGGIEGLGRAMFERSPVAALAQMRQQATALLAYRSSKGTPGDSIPVGAVVDPRLGPFAYQSLAALRLLTFRDYFVFFFTYQIAYR